MAMGTQITALEFDERRAELIRLHEENPGKRGYEEAGPEETAEDDQDEGVA